MERNKVKSKLLASVGYDHETKILEVQFLSGSIYRYSDVPPEKVTKMMEDKSIGGYFLARIKPEHKYTRIEEKKDEQAPPPEAA